MLSILLLGGVVLCAVRWQVWFGNPPEPEWTADTLDTHFTTFATLPYDQCDSLMGQHPLSILVFGDVHNSISREQYMAVAERHPHVDCYAQLGDFMDRGYFYYAQQLVHQLDSTPFRTLPIINCAGNHEYRKGIARRLPAWWQEMFPQPDNGPLNFVGRSYFIDFPYLRFIVIDTNGIHDLRDFTRVVTWLKSVIRFNDSPARSAVQPFTVVMMHHPVLSSAKKRFNAGVFAFFYRTLSGADLVFAGHDHNYARRLPFVNLSSVTTRSRAVSNAMYGYLPFDCSASGVFYALLTIDRGNMVLQVFDLQTGEPIDSITFTR